VKWWRVFASEFRIPTSEFPMAFDIFDDLAESPIPPPPAEFDTLVHKRLNRRIVAGQMADLVLRGMPYALAHFAQAVAGAVRFTVFGDYKDDDR